MANEIWASDANYPAGTDPWSGQPTKVAPDAGEIAAGHTPGLKRPAETDNWWKNRTDTRLTGLEDIDADTRLDVLETPRSVTFPMRPYLAGDVDTVVTFDGLPGETLKCSAKLSGATSGARFAFPLETGRTLLGFKVLMNGDGAVDIDIEFYLSRGISETALTVDPATLADVASSGGTLYTFEITEVAGDPAVEYSVQEGDILVFRPKPNAAGIVIHSLIVLYKPSAVAVET